MKQNSLKKHLLVFAAATLIAAVLIGGLLCAMGRTFTFPVHEYTPYRDVLVEFETPGVAEVISKEKKDDNWVIRFRAVAPGSTAVTVICPHLNEGYQLNDSVGTYLHVTKLRTIIEVGRVRFSGTHVLCCGLSIYFLFVGVYLFLQYRRQKKTDFFSHETVLYLGLSLFILLLGLLFLALEGFCLVMVEDANGEMLFFVLQYALTALVIVSLPLVILFAFAISFSNVWLVRHEGFRPGNLLGILLGAFMLCGVGACIVIAIVNARDLFSFEPKTVVISAVRTIVSAVYLYFSVMLFATQYCCVIAGRRKVAFNKDYILILGCAIRKDGTPYPLLQGRVDRAVAFFRRQKEETGKEAMFLPSGGQGPDEVISEAECIRRYLCTQGIDEAQILPEAASTSTLENMKFSKALIDARTPDAKVVFSTTNYHAFRSGVLARDVGLNADAVTGKTKWYFWPNAQIREFVALLSRSWKLHLTVSVLLIAVSLLLSNMGTLVNHILH